MTLPTWENIIFSKDGAMYALYKMIKQVAAGDMAAGSVQTDDVANGAITEGKIATGAVTSGKLGNGAVSTAKIADDAVTPAKISGVGIDSAGVTITALTAAIGDPATLNDGVYIVKDTADSNKIKPVYVKGGAFLVGAAATAAV